MFERFTQGARQVVAGAQDEAQMLRHDFIGTEHLLLAILRLDADPAAAALTAAGLDLETARADVARLIGGGFDGAALASIGVDLDAVRDAVEASFGPGALDGLSGAGDENPGRSRIRFSRRAKKTLELALREAIRLKQREIAPGHLLLGLLREGEGLAVRVLSDRGVDCAALRREVEAKLA